MPTSGIRRVLRTGIALAGVTFATLAWAETRPPAPPPTPAGHGVAPPKGVKWEGPDYDATRNLKPAGSKGFLPEVGDEVLTVKGRRKGR